MYLVSILYTIFQFSHKPFSIVSIWSPTFQYHVNLILPVIFWIKIDSASNGQNKKLAFIDVKIY